MNNCSENSDTSHYSALHWQVPLYLFSGVGAVMLILVFSCWKLDHRNNNEVRDHIDLSPHPCSAGIDYS